jgi:hypothetical protein
MSRRSHRGIRQYAEPFDMGLVLRAARVLAEKMRIDGLASSKTPVDPRHIAAAMATGVWDVEKMGESETSTMLKLTPNAARMERWLRGEGPQCGSRTPACG